MKFFEQEPLSFPAEAQFYYNVLVICVAIPLERAKDVLGNLTDIWYLQDVNDTRPCAYHFFLNDESKRDDDGNVVYPIEFHPHSVVEADPILGVSFYQMMDDNGALWRVD